MQLQFIHEQLARNLKRLELPRLNGLLCLLGELNGPCQADDLAWHALEVNVLHTIAQQALQTCKLSGHLWYLTETAGCVHCMFCTMTVHMCKLLVMLRLTDSPGRVLL